MLVFSDLRKYGRTWVWVWACVWVCVGVRVASAVKKNHDTADRLLMPEYLLQIFGFDQLVGETLKLLPQPTTEATRYLEWYRWRVVDAAGAGGDLVGEAITGNHLHVYSLLKRVVLLWPSVRKTLYELKENVPCEDKSKFCSEWKKEGHCLQEPTFMMSHCQRSCGGCHLLDGVEAIREKERCVRLPKVEALNGAAEAIGRLQHVYNLNIRRLVNGQQLTVVSSVHLSLWDCIRVARSSKSRGRYSNAWVWYQQALTMTSDPDLSGYINDLVLSLTKLHDDTWVPDEYHLSHKISSGKKLMVLRSNLVGNCNSEFGKRSRKDMKCHVTALGSAFLLLQPAKQEILSLDPLIFIIHDAITNNQADQLINFTHHQLERDDNPDREGAQALLADNTLPVADMMARWATLLTGLHVNKDKYNILGDSKVRHYGPGGHLGRHFDVRFKHLPEKTSGEMFIDGDRLLTSLFYLNDVLSGGRTAFYQLGLAVTPKKGAAVLWYNLKKNGDYDRRLDHCGCPVLLGSKRVGLKWVRDNINFLTYPCSLDPNE